MVRRLKKLLILLGRQILLENTSVTPLCAVLLTTGPVTGPLLATTGLRLVPR